MQRMLTALLAVGLALSSTGCARRYYYDDDGRRWGRWERETSDRDHGATGRRLDLNRASARDLDRLPSLSQKDAHRIVVNRPYDAKRDLVDRRIIGPRQYERIEDFVYAGRLRERYDDHRDDEHYRPYSRDDNRYQERRFYDDR